MATAPGIEFTLLPGCRCRGSSRLVMVRPDSWPVLSPGAWPPSPVAAHDSGQCAPLKQQREGWWESGQWRQLTSIRRSQQTGICSQITRGSACECSRCEGTLTHSPLCECPPTFLILFPGGEWPWASRNHISSRLSTTCLHFGLFNFEEIPFGGILLSLWQIFA